MKRILIAPAFAGVLFACNSAPVLNKFGPNATCSNGGVGILDVPGKVQVVCNVPGQLLVQTPLPLGDVNCPGGGVRVDTGVDNGAGGGTPGDGILQSGEITGTKYLCGNANGAVVASMTPPAGAAGTATISANGGAGTSGAGGRGGVVNIGMGSGSDGGHVKLFQTGAVDASFTLPALTPVLGASPATISTSTTLTTQASTTPALAAGTPFIYTASNALYIAGASGGTPATGLSVAAGVTLTFPSNATVKVPGSCVIAGTLQASAASATQTGNVTLNCGDYSGAAGSMLDARGAIAGPGAKGGTFAVQAAGVLVNQGSIDVSGSAGSPGGAGGTVQLQSTAAPLANTGNIKSSGGDATAGIGGKGGQITLIGPLGLFNSGALDARGARGILGTTQTIAPFTVTPASGQGGAVVLVAVGGARGLVNSGAADVSAGSVDAACVPASGTNCVAANAGVVELINANCSATDAGQFTARGGTSPSDRGGAGGTVYLLPNSSNTPAGSNVASQGGVVHSGSIDVGGGAGATGGGAGTVYISGGSSNAPLGIEVQVLGTSLVTARGGAGSTSGGAGGSIVLIQNTGSVAGNIIPGGAVLNTAALDTSGGAGTTAAGGQGGSLRLTTQTSFFADAPFEVVVNAGPLTANGGAGASGGNSGLVTLSGRTGLTNSGAIAAQGGAGSAGTGGSGRTGGGYPQTVLFEAVDGSVTNSAPVDVTGGAAAGAFKGGNAGTIVLEGNVGVVQSGTLKLDGGAGDPATGAGGNGGLLAAYTLTGINTVNTAPAPAGISVRGGAAKTPGNPGKIFFDGRLETAAYQH